MDRGLNLEQLLLMKEAFEAGVTNLLEKYPAGFIFKKSWLFLQGTGKAAGGELTQDEFFEKLSPFLGTKASREAMAQTFMKIDADCGGTVNWCETF